MITMLIAIANTATCDEILNDWNPLPCPDNEWSGSGHEYRMQLCTQMVSEYYPFYPLIYYGAGKKY